MGGLILEPVLLSMGGLILKSALLLVLPKEKWPEQSLANLELELERLLVLW